MLRRTIFLVALVLFTPSAVAQAAITVDDVSVTEGGKLAFTVSSDALAFGVEVTTADGTAKAGSDYETKSQTVNFPALNGGQQTFEVQTTLDSTPETDETLTVTATPASGTPDSGTGTIKNDDTPTLGLGDVSVSESAGSASLTITSQAISADVTVDFATSDDTAKAGSDYTGTSGSATIKAGTGSTTISVPIANDGDDEDDERLTVKLANAKGAGIADADGAVTITNDDGRLISVGDVGVVEGDGEQTIARFPVQLSAPTFRTVSVAFVTVDSSAKAPRDYLARFGAVTIAPGQTTAFIDVAIATDDVIEPAETFGIIIGQAQGARILRSGALGAITDDDSNDRNGADRDSPRMKLTKPRLSGSRSIRARVSCPRTETRCKGRLVLYAKVGTSERRVGSKTFTLPGNAARTLRITIPRSFVSRARRTGRLAIRAYMVTSDAAENVDTTTASATLRFRRSR